MRSQENLTGKSCQRQEVLTVEATFDSDKVTDGLLELTMRQNPNPKNFDIFYGFDTLLREKELSNFH